MVSFTIGFLASHNGSNVRAVIKAMDDGALASRAGIIISNNSTSGIAGFAREFQIPFKHLSGKTNATMESLDHAVCNSLREHNVDLVLVLGYMKKAGPLTRQAFDGRIFNIHPALLPKFGGQGMYGNRVHEAVIESGDRITGVTVHAVTEEYDTGPIVAQRTVPVEVGDTAAALAERVLTVEHQLIVDVVRGFEIGELRLPGEPNSAKTSFHSFLRSQSGPPREM